jgi:hypothetical protein
VDKNLGGAGSERGEHVVEVSDSGLVVTGYTYSYGAGYSDLLLAKFDGSGNTCLGEFVTPTVQSVSPTINTPSATVDTVSPTATSPSPTVTSPSPDTTVVCPTPPPTIVSTSPAQNELHLPVNTNISVTFDIDMNETTINDSTFVMNARSTGLHEGTITYDSLTKTATFDPTNDFAVGEVVTAVLTTDIQSSQGTSLDSSYVWSFNIEVNNGLGTFVLDSVYGFGVRTYIVFAADLDSDGDVDLTTANRAAENVTVLLNHGDGTFAVDSLYGIGGDAYGVFAADLDGDGDLDVVTGNLDSDSVFVLLNDGDGTFAFDSAYSVYDSPWTVFAADLDGDGDLDLATTAANWRVSVLLNNEDGTFASYSAYYTDTSQPFTVFAADLDGDGDLDLPTANSHSDTISILLNDGTGTFVAGSGYPVGDYPASVFAADLDGDADLDLATANNLSDDAYVLLNNGTFTPDSVYPAGSNPLSVFAADLDVDGDLDLANASRYGVSVLLNEGGVGVGDEQLPSLPAEFALAQNHPNPFNPVTAINYALPKDSHVRLIIYNILGQRVATLVDGKQKAGYKTARWDASEMASGIYFYRLRAGDFVQTRKMVLIR